MIFGCSGAGNFNHNELVMSEGMVIEASNDHGIIVIEAGKGLKRTYLNENKKLSLKMRNRRERWDGSLGAYNPAGGRGDIHLIVQEGQQHFCDEKEAIEWLNWRNDRMRYVYTLDGLVVGFYITKDPNSSRIAKSVEVWQFYIKGKKPNNMQGAMSDQVRVFFKDGYKPKYPPKGNFEPSNPKTINGYVFSGKAVDHMKENKFKFVNTEKKVIKLIMFGEVGKKGEYITYYGMGDKFDPFEDLHWVKLDKEGRVVLFD
jgi:hypothetical protein